MPNQEHLDSGDREYYTPDRIVRLVRDLFGEIDLDPASCLEANQTVQARTYYTKHQDGLILPWFGKVWLNHPFDRRHNDTWVERLINSYEHGRVTEACCITWANVGSGWFNKLSHYPQLYPYKRIHYYSPRGASRSAAPKASVITYLGDRPEAFAYHFRPLGKIKVNI